MSILKPGDIDYPTDETCVLCGAPAADKQEPVVCWMTGAVGAAPEFLYWHAGCVGSFTLRLARDAWEVENKRGDGKIEYSDRYAGAYRGGEPKRI